MARPVGSSSITATPGMISTSRRDPRLRDVARRVEGYRGNGLKLMRALMDDVIVDTSAAGTVVLLRRRTAA